MIGNVYVAKVTGVGKKSDRKLALPSAKLGKGNDGILSELQHIATNV